MIQFFFSLLCTCVTARAIIVNSLLSSSETLPFFLGVSTASDIAQKENIISENLRLHILLNILHSPKGKHYFRKAYLTQTLLPIQA